MKHAYLEYYGLIFALVIGFTWFLYPQLPPVMVTHWGLFGQANGWMAKSMGAWIIPLILGIVWLIWEAAPLTLEEYDNETFYPPYRLLGLFVFLFLGTIHFIALGINLGWHIDLLKALSWLFVVFAAILGQLLPITPKNPIMGIRTPWSMKSKGVWRKTHKEAGRWFRAASLVDIIFLLTLSRPWGFLAVISSFIVCLLLGVWFSYVYRRY